MVSKESACMQRMVSKEPPCIEYLISKKPRCYEARGNLGSSIILDVNMTAGNQHNIRYQHDIREPV